MLRTHRIGSQPGRIHVYVENSGEMLPDIISLFARGSDIDIQQAEKYEPPFDDIFRILMQQEDERDLAEVMT